MPSRASTRWRHTSGRGSSSFPPTACQPIEGGYDIRTVQELLGHNSVETTMIYTHVMNKGVRGVRSPLDRMEQPRAGYGA